MSSAATITPVLCPLTLQSLLDMNGDPIVGGQLFLYAAGTTNAITVYRDAGLTQPFPAPILTDLYGRIPAIWIGVGAYRIDVRDNTGALITSIDQMPGGTATSATPATPAQTFTTGDLKARYGTDQINGFLLCNGETIGNAASAATSRANADCQNLYLYLWNLNNGAGVVGGAGVSANSDWTAAKSIAIPDLRGRVLVGCDKMGAPASAGIITAASIPAPASTDQPGTAFGSETQTLAVAQLPAITPTITVDGGVASPGLHGHTAQVQAGGAFTPSFTDNGHSHGETIQTDNSHFATPNNGGSTCLAQVYPASQTTQPATTGITMNAVPAHTHTATVDNGNSGGSHTHSAACSSFGGGQAHGNVQPGTLVYWHIAL